MPTYEQNLRRIAELELEASVSSSSHFSPTIRAFNRRLQTRRGRATTFINRYNQAKVSELSYGLTGGNMILKGNVNKLKIKLACPKCLKLYTVLVGSVTRKKWKITEKLLSLYPEFADAEYILLCKPCFKGK